MKISMSRQNIYLLSLSVFLLIFVFIFSFSLLIPEGKEYRKNKVSLKKETKERLRYVILFALGASGQFLISETIELEKAGDLSPAFGAMAATWLGTIGYVIKWFFTSSPGESSNV